MYLGFSILCMLGLHRIVQLFSEGVKLVFFHRPGGFFLEVSDDPVRMLDLAERSFTIEALAVSALVVCAGLPVLVFLREAIARA